MSEENTTHTEANQVNQPSTEASQNNVSDGIPKHRFDEVNNKYKDMTTQNQELKAQLDEFKKTQAAEKQKQLEEQGKWKDIAEQRGQELEKAQADVAKWSEYKTNKRSTLMEQLTDDSDKTIAEGLSLEKLELYVGKVTKANPLPTNTARAASQQPQGDFGGYSSYAEWAAKDPKGYEEANGQVNLGGIPIGVEQ
ncbi:MAG: hypothetical protein Unbinned2716contig1004_24 [Prokaryotic dsDNA virus sp.]|nr:MAG: hypothetical protein Unbinned2716contig1004_24 [Prokaryotic dsDNA virus sp.]|tara:strand:- start:11546 stop:12130 length:585 start_codon:yes stop_codon:yes gene_type:complete